MSRRVWGALGAIAVAIAWVGLGAQTNVTLQPATSPSAAPPGVQLVNVTGSNFPAGTIPPANVTVTLSPSTPGAGPGGTAVASAVQTLTGTARRVTFQVPANIVVASPVAYRVAIAGTTSTGVAF